MVHGLRSFCAEEPQSFCKAKLCATPASNPIAERTVKETIGDVPYTLTIKGNTVSMIDPRGKYGALYERAYYRQNEAPWRKVTRFVPDQALVW